MSPATKRGRHKPCLGRRTRQESGDRKSTRLNSSHDQISYAVFCLKKKNRRERKSRRLNSSHDHTSHPDFCLKKTGVVGICQWKVTGGIGTQLQSADRT